MKNLAFVLWMLFFPITTEVVNYLQFLKNGIKVNIEISGPASIINIIIWVFVGILLYEKKNKS